MFRPATTIGLILIGLVSMPAIPLSAEDQKPFDTSYIAPDSFFTIVVRPARLLNYVAKEKAATLVETIRKETSLDPRTMDEFIVDFGKFAENKTPLNDDDHIAILARFTKPFDRDAFLNKFPGSKQPATHDGKEFYPGEGGSQPGLFIPNDSSFVLAKNERLKQTMSQPHSMNTMVSRLRKAGRDYDLLMIADVDSARTLITDFLRMAAAAGLGEFKPGQYVEKVDAVKLRAKLSEDIPLTIDVDTINEEAADEIKGVCAGLLLLGKTMWSGMREGLLDADPDKEMAKMAVGVVDDLLAGTKIESKGAQVAIRVEKKGGFGDLVEFAAMGMFGVQRVEAKVEADVFDGPVPAPVPDPPKAPKVPPKPVGPKR